MAQPRHGSHRYAGYGSAAADQPTGRRRWGLIVAGLVLLGVGVVGLWVAVRGYEAAHALRAAKSDLAAIPGTLAAGNVDQAGLLLRAAQQETATADSASHDPFVRLAAHVPFVGTTPRALGEVSAVADDLTHGALVDLVDAGAALDPTTLRVRGDTVNLDALATAQPHLSDAYAGLLAANHRLDALDVSKAPTIVQNAVTAMTDELSSVTHTTQNALQATELAVPMLGADGPRRYLLLLQSNAELRGTGGFAGQWGILEADHGQVRITKLGPSSKFASWQYDTLPVDFGREYDALYGNQPGLWTSANMSPHFPYAAQLWLRMYQDHTGQKLDGVISTDVVALSYLLDATGPLRLPDGSRVDASSVVPLLENGIYSTISNDGARDAYLQRVTQDAFNAVLSGRAGAAATVDALAKAADQRRLLVYSTRAGEQQVIEQTAVSGAIPTGKGPFAGFAVINASGSKLDYYLSSSLDYSLLGCSATGQRTTRITVTLDNAAPAHGLGLPLYVDQRIDLPARANGLPALGHGQDFVYVQVYGAQGARLIAATQDGTAADVSTGAERGHPVFRIPVTIDAQGHAVLTLDLREPASDQPVQVMAQPQVKYPTVTADDRQCPTSG